MSISLAALVCILALPVRVSEIHLWTQAESVNKCNVVVFQRIAKFIPLIMASSSVRLIYWESFAGRNQQASYSPIIYKRHTGSERAYVNPYTKGLAVDAPSAPHLVFLAHSSENLFNHCVERGIVNFFIRSRGDVRCSPLNECYSYMKLSTHGKVPNQFAA